jgi:hypothetical protein
LSYQCFSRSIKPYVQSIFTIHSPVSDVTSQTRLVATDGSFDAAESPELATDKDCVRYRTSHSEGVTHAYYAAITLPYLCVSYPPPTPYPHLTRAVTRVGRAQAATLIRWIGIPPQRPTGNSLIFISIR